MIDAVLLTWEIARKDLLLFAADRRGMLLCFGVPILLASVFGAIFHRPAIDNLRPRVLVVAAEKSDFTDMLTRQLRDCDRLDASAGEPADAVRRLADGAVDVVAELPAGLDKLSLLKPSADRPTIRLRHGPNALVEARWVEGVLTELVLRELAKRQLARFGQELPTDRPFEVTRASESAAGALSANAYSHAFCGMTLQYLLFWGMDSGLMLLRERRQGIWRRLRAAPVSPWVLLLGKALATAIIALAQIAATFAFGAVVFGVGVSGSLVGFAMMALSAAILSAATGLVVAAAGGNETRARSVSILAILTLSLLGGLWLPAFLLPAWAQKLALLLPTTWAAKGLEGVVWQGMGLGRCATCAAVLLGFSVVFLVLACRRLAADDRTTEGAKSWLG